MPSERFNLFISDWEDAPARLPAGMSAWAIGDVHGYLDHLNALLKVVETLVAQAPPGPRHLVMMGDYIDRGPANIGVLQRVAALRIPGVTVTCLLGNHEQYLDTLLNDKTMEPDFVDLWTANGGLATLVDMGVFPGDIRRYGPLAMIDQIRATAPASLRRALGELELTIRLGGYLFAHAGVHPLHPLDDADQQRFTTIRQPFLDGEGWIHDFAVVHGHSIVGPDVERHRIAVDSGCYHTGVLTCVELREDRARFICATRDENLGGLLKIRGRRPLSSETWRRMAG